MTTPFQLHDIGSILGAEPVGDALALAVSLSSTPFSSTSLIQVLPHGQHETGAAAHEERIYLVIAGHATVTVDDCRQTLGSGHMMTVEPGANVKIWNESDRKWIALCIETPPAGNT